MDKIDSSETFWGCPKRVISKTVDFDNLSTKLSTAALLSAVTKTLCLFLTVGCTKKDDIVNSNIEEDKPEVPQVEDTYIDDNPIKVGLYMNGKLINEYNTKIMMFKKLYFKY